MTTVPRSSYGEWAPPAGLAPWVVCFWRQEIAPGADPYRQRVLPDGCVDLVLLPEHQVLIAGPATSSVVVEMPPGTTTHGIRFRPGMAGAALGLPAAEVLDAEAPLEVAWPDWASLEVPLTAELTRRLRTKSPDGLVAEAVRRLQLGGSQVHDLASDLGIGATSGAGSTRRSGTRPRPSTAYCASSASCASPSNRARLHPTSR